MPIVTIPSLTDMGPRLRHIRLGLFGLCAVLLCACNGSDGKGGRNIAANAAAPTIAASGLVDAPIAVTPLTAPGAAALAPDAGTLPVAPAAAKTAPPPRNPQAGAVVNPAIAVPAAVKPQGAEPVATQVPIVEPQDFSPQAAACRKKGKIWGDAGSQGAKACISQTSDAGKSCKSGQDCQGFCLARSGTCAPFTPLFGCNDILQDDGVEVTMCLD